MLKNSLRALSACTCVLSFGQACASGFVDDSHADLTMRNFYFDRNYVNATPQAAAREWAQGFVLNVRSGYTEGPVGFGLDAQGLMACTWILHAAAPAPACCRTAPPPVSRPMNIRSWV